MPNSDDYLKQYLDRLVEKIGMGGIEPAKLEKLKESLSRRLETKILLELTAQLPEEEAKKIREKTESAPEGEQEKVLADFIQEKVKAEPQKLGAILQEFEKQVVEEKNLIFKAKSLVGTGDSTTPQPTHTVQPAGQTETPETPPASPGATPPTPPGTSQEQSSNEYYQ